MVQHVRPNCMGMQLQQGLASVATIGDGNMPSVEWDTPVVLFSGLSNNDIRVLARVLVGSLFASRGRKAAVAKAVPPAMRKSMLQLFEEIARDHEEAISKARAV